jgi:hypothetical protein
MAATEMSLRDLVDLMASHKLRRLKLQEIEIEMDPAGFTVAAEVEAGTTATLEDDKGQVCACGHGIMSEHNEHGCLHGCSIEVCAPVSQPRAEA